MGAEGDSVGTLNHQMRLDSIIDLIFCNTEV
jgi:hypothetical protein